MRFAMWVTAVSLVAISSADISGKGMIAASARSLGSPKPAGHEAVAIKVSNENPGRVKLSGPDEQPHHTPISLGGASGFGSKLFWDNPFRIELELLQGDQLLFKTEVSLDPADLKRGRSGYRWNHDTDHHFVLDPASEITIRGEIANTNGIWLLRKSTKFDKTFEIADLAPWTSVLRDEEMEFGDRLDAFQKRILELDPDFDEFLEIVHVDLTHQGVTDNSRAKIGVEIPRELEAFATRRVRLSDEALFIGPAEAYANTLDKEKSRWLTLAEFDNLFAGEPEEVFRSRGEEHIEIATRHVTISSYFGDGPTTIVWDPTAQENEVAFFEVEPDTRELTALRNYSGQPISALDALLAVLDWSQGWKEARWDYPESWVSVAVERILPNIEMENILVVDSSNPNGVLSVTFDAETGEPSVFFDGQTWLSETIWYR